MFSCRQFDLYAEDVARSARSSIQGVIEVGNSISIAFTSYALDRGLSFPKVTLPDFQVRVDKAIQITRSDAIIWYPLVDDTERQDWEDYTVTAGPEWLRSALDQSGQEDAEIPEFSTQIHNFQGQPVEGPLVTGDETLS